jgi:hypothetical protein
MRRFLTELIQSSVLPDTNETFQGHYLDPSKFSGKQGIVILVSFILVELLVLFFGKFLWNSVVVNLVSGVNKATSIWQILGFSILLKLITN